MRCKNVLRTSLAAALAISAWATVGLASGPASAAAADRVSPPSPSPSSVTDEAPASAGLLLAMRRDLGLAEGQARRRLAAEKTATAVQQRARRAAGPSYAGAWFDPATNRLAVAVADARVSGAVRESGASVRLVRHSARQLGAAKARIDRLKAPGGVSGWHIDPKANRVVVDVVTSAAADNDVRDFVDRARATGPVVVRRTPEAPRTLAAGTVGGDPYYTGNVRCSIGFSVYGGFVTAGHCGQAGASVSGWDRSAIGNFQGSSFPGDDYAWVSVGNGWWTVPVVLGWGAVSDQLVRGSAEAPIGASICRSGSTSHWHCGTVLATNETVNYSQGAVYQMTKTSVCAEPGDSGGSFISGDQAQGVTSGGWGNCTSGGETWHQPVNEILGRYGLTLHTS
ncbi:S1 family peptidase [Streptomyces sp. NPDC058195]|uniref:S1 family peptidase n=1 Tax=Streptomyces sp. NPDC058195 TaxID=3346375 RepID=UPI0036E1BEA7